MVKYKYSAEQVVFLQKAYTEDKLPLADIAASMQEKFKQEWSVRSLRGKLISLGLYKKVGYVNKLGQKPQTKEELIAILAKKLGKEEELLDSLVKANKMVLQWIIEALDE
jgi:hypothetical protein